MEARETAMLEALQDLELFSPTLRQRMAHLEYVPTAGGGVASPTALYDPRNSELCAMLGAERVFPVGRFSTDKARPTLPKPRPPCGAPTPYLSVHLLHKEAL